MYIISTFQANKLLAAKALGQDHADISLDLGHTKSTIMIDKDSFIFPDSQRLSASDLKKAVKKDTMCFSVEENQLVKLSIFSDETNNFYKLVPTGENTPPTIEISGIRMHVTKKYSPKEDTEEKVSYIRPVEGNVLDTCTGLGYTAIESSKDAKEVFTFERDPNVIELQKINPWSRELFSSPKIKRHFGDVFVEIKKLPSGHFDRIIHDPPRLALSTLLYSQEFYSQLFRVMRPGGKLYHYTGDPGAKRGLDIRAGIIQRLSIAGFRNLERVFNGVKAGK